MKTKLFILFCLVCVVLLNCAKAPTVEEIVDQAGEIEVVFYPAEGATKEVVVLATDAKEDFKSYISNDAAPEYKCGYEGKVRLHLADEKMDMEFNLSEDCRHIVYVLEGVLYSKELSKGGYNYLSELQRKIFEAEK